ncbi:MAG: cell filamentation protein Fic [Piscirickettsiaceae bacterium]|nr:MAG: cell filamentation protein Fic [Piscirickettsiaceae bacterium]
MTNRYDASGLMEGQYEPGSSNTVLANKLGIADSAEMDQLELELLAELTQVLFDEIEEGQALSITDLCEWHRRWLGNVYDWAGQYRSVNIAKGNFQFATALLVPKLMDTFEKNFLHAKACNKNMTDDALIDSLAVIHTEFILIHPFREGNGRLSRLLAVVMALQAGRSVLDFSWLDDHKEEYFLAVQASLDNVEPMKAVFRQVLRDTETSSG